MCWYNWKYLQKNYSSLTKHQLIVLLIELWMNIFVFASRIFYAMKENRILNTVLNENNMQIEITHSCAIVKGKYIFGLVTMTDLFTRKLLKLSKFVMNAMTHIFFTNNNMKVSWVRMSLILNYNFTYMIRSIYWYLMMCNSLLFLVYRSNVLTRPLFRRKITFDN